MGRVNERSFGNSETAQAIIDPVRKNAVLVVTNVRTSHNHHFKAMNKIKEHYLSIADLPGINSR